MHTCMSASIHAACSRALSMEWAVIDAGLPYPYICMLPKVACCLQEMLHAQACSIMDFIMFSTPARCHFQFCKHMVTICCFVSSACVTLLQIDTPTDMPAKDRFARYRGLKSFRSSPWDAREGLPQEYSSTFAFENFKRAHKR